MMQNIRIVARIAAAILFVVLWIWFSYVDWRTKTISNKNIVYGFTPALFLFLIIHPISVWRCVLAGVTVETIFALIFWYLRIWPAGDAKLLIALALFLPYLGLARFSSIFSLCFDHVVNILTLASAWFILDKSFLWINGGKFPSLAILADKIPFFSLLYAIAAVLVQILGMTSRFNGIVEIIFSFWVAGKIARGIVHLVEAKKNKIWGAFALCLAIAYVLNPAQGFISFCFSFAHIFIYGTILQIGFLVIALLASSGEILKINVRNVRSKQLLSESSIGELKSISASLFERIGPLYPDGLSVGQARLIRHWAQSRDIGEIEISKTHAFTFWLFLGTALTWFLRQNIVSFILRRTW